MNSDENAALTAEILEIKSRLAERLVIAAHHYQRPEIVALADLTGDSYRLAVEASRSPAEFIVLCGVRFMAESAAILCNDDQRVLLSDHQAGCPMADMISAETAAATLIRLRGVVSAPVIPLTYMNSWADLKALTGREDGAICTSGNAHILMRRFLDNGKAIFFLPDYNLGYNTARDLSIPDNQICTVRKEGKLDCAGPLSEARLFLWDGFCHVHKVFTAADIHTAREQHRGIKVIVHPECSPEVVALADQAGSTEGMFRILRDAPAGSSWAVGTEARFVDRMIANFPDKQIFHLRHSLCMNMDRINLLNLAATLRALERHIAGGERLNTITVAPGDRLDAKKALDTMIALTEGRP